MYAVVVGKSKSTASSYAAATSDAKAAVRALAAAKSAEADAVAASGNTLYKSAKTRNRVAEALRRQGVNLLNAADALKFPRTAGNVSTVARNIPVTIAKV